MLVDLAYRAREFRRDNEWDVDAGWDAFNQLEEHIRSELAAVQRLKKHAET